MRMIKEGTIFHAWHGRWNCPHCHASWELDNSDSAPSLQDDWRDGDYYVMPCPTCNKSVTRSRKTPNYYEDH